MRTSIVTVLALVIVPACSHDSAGRPAATTRPAGATTTSATTNPTPANTPPEPLDLDRFMAKYAHGGNDDRALLANNGFTRGLAAVGRGGVLVITLEFQGRDGAAETHASWLAAGNQRPEARRFDVPGIRSAVGVSWFEGAGAITVQQVLFVKGPTLYVVEAHRSGHATDTTGVVAVARDANAATG